MVPLLLRIGAVQPALVGFHGPAFWFGLSGEGAEQPAQAVVSGRGKRAKKPQPPTILSHYYAGTDKAKPAEPIRPEPAEAVPGPETARREAQVAALAELAGAVLAAEGTAALATQLALEQIQRAALAAEAARAAKAAEMAAAEQRAQAELLARLAFEQSIEDDAIALLLLTN